MELSKELEKKLSLDDNKNKNKNDILKNDILLILNNNKITVKILKECILKMNQELNINMKVSGTKEILIERLNDILKTI